MSTLIEFLAGILKEWYTEIIAILVGMAFVWILGLLPSKFQYHKRLNFALKISKAISKIDVSIETKNIIKLQEIKKTLQEFLRNDFIEGITLQRDLLFNSNKSGGSYKISSTKDEETERFFVTISSFNAFGIGLFGRIKGLSSTIGELQSILDSFNRAKQETDKITIHITITPRRKSTEKDKMQVKYDENNFSTAYTIKNIKIVNNGMASLDNNVNKVFYEWMTSLL